ncbi:hypothetical protein BC828DRAFT_392571 [Blastocladiella britannica]|nr:hypothetical protein BC828DRAFT_392571 [Blastocladiella britannica]
MSSITWPDHHAHQNPLLVAGDRVIDASLTALPYRNLTGATATVLFAPPTRDYRGRFSGSAVLRRTTPYLSLPVEDDDCDTLAGGARARTAGTEHRDNKAILHLSPHATSLTIARHGIAMDDDAADYFGPLAEDEEMTEHSAAVISVAFDQSLSAISLLPWEDAVQWDIPSTPTALSVLDEINAMERDNCQMSRLPIRNAALDTADGQSWNLLQANMSLRLLDDPTSLLPPWFVHSSVRRDLSGGHLDRYFLSNDSSYSTAKRRYGDQTDILTTPVHAGPAVRLALSYYKPELTAKQLRHLYRPPFYIELGSTFKFSKVRTLKKKKLKERDNVDLLKSCRDMTLRDTSNFVLLEYSEEAPTILSGIGMASFIFKYYRRLSAADANVPKDGIGAECVLEPSAPSPFWDFGFVDQGKLVHALCNNMFRAPLFPQAPLSTDFLLIRYTFKGVTKHYLRSIPHQFVVGQMFPVIPIEPPTARKYTEYKRNRIRIGVFRRMRKIPNSQMEGIPFEMCERMSPHYTEVALKSRLKEFMESRGLASGHWRLKDGQPPPPEEEFQNQVTPEDVCMYYAMEAAQRHLSDLAYVPKSNLKCTTSHVLPKKELEFERSMVGWQVTRNFVDARDLAKAKHQLQLTGEGDPTGRARAGFSFLKARGMGAKATGVTSSADAMDPQDYKLAIRSTWERQAAQLSSDGPFSRHEPMESVFASAFRDFVTQNNWSPSQPLSSAVWRSEVSKRCASRARDANPPAPVSRLHSTSMKVLVIRRRPRGLNTWQEEFVTDPLVIESYLRHKQQLDNAGSGSSLDKFRKQKLMTGNRLYRENVILEALRKSRQVQCRACGQIGHISTNREVCPNSGYIAPAKPVKRGRGRDGDDDDDAPPSQGGRGASKRHKRRHPAQDLSEVFDQILSEVKLVPEHEYFMMRAKPDPEYCQKVGGIHAVVSLATIANKNSDSHYASSEELLADIRQMRFNTHTVFGAASPQAKAADVIYDIVARGINARQDRVAHIQDEIRKDPRPVRGSTASIRGNRARRGGRGGK